MTSVQGNCPLFQHLFSDAEYKRLCSSDRSLIPHFRIARHKASVADIDALKNNLNYPFPKLKLTALHIAVIVNHKTAVVKLLEAGASFAEQDEIGNTILHHAAFLPDISMLQLLSSKVDMAAIAHLRNSYGGTYLDCRRLIAPPPIDPAKPVCLFREKDGSFVYKTAAEFQQLTGAEFVEWVVTDAATVVEEWLDPAPKEKPGFFQSCLEQDFSFRENLSDLFLAQNENPDVGLDVYANRDFKPRELIAIYGGEQISKNPKDLQYSLGKTSAFRKRNAYAPHINDGFPNCCFDSFSRAHGLSEISFVMAVQPIQKGSRLLVDYGWDHSVKRGKHLEIGKSELLNWIRMQGGLEASVKFVANGRKQGTFHDKQAYFTMQEVSCKLGYILNQATLSELILDGILDPHAMLKLIASEDFITTFNLTGSIAKHLRILEPWASILSSLNSHEDPSLAAAIRKFLQSQLGQISTIDLCIFLDFLEKDLRKKAIPSHEAWALKKESYSRIMSCRTKIASQFLTFHKKIESGQTVEETITQESINPILQLILAEPLPIQHPMIREEIPDILADYSGPIKKRFSNLFFKPF